MATAPAARSQSSTTYRALLDATAHAIARRGTQHRNLVVTVVLIVIGTIVWSVASRSANRLAALLALVPTCGMFFCADARVLARWRSNILERWVDREIELAALCSAVRANPTLPGATTEAMLQSLPAPATVAEDQRLSAPTRRAIAADNRLHHTTQAARLWLNSVASAIVTASVVAAMWTRTLFPFWGLTLLAFRPVVGAWLRRRALRARDEEIAAAQSSSDFDLQAVFGAERP